MKREVSFFHKEFLDKCGSHNKKSVRKLLKNRKIKKIKMADNIIASTAQVYNLILVTRNVKDFKNIALNILNPFEG